LTSRPSVTNISCWEVTTRFPSLSLSSLTVSVPAAAPDGSEDEDGWNAGFLLTKQLSQRSSVSGIYDYNSNIAARGFGSTVADGASGAENRFTLVFNHTF